MSESIKSVGVIGAGEMGVGIAHVCAASGFNINLVDISEIILSKAMETIEQNLSRLVKRGKMTEEQKNDALNKVTISLDISMLANCDLVIEAATEDENVKKEIYEKICPILKDNAILATNSSSISLSHFSKQFNTKSIPISVSASNSPRAYIVKRGGC